MFAQKCSHSIIYTYRGFRLPWNRRNYFRGARRACTRVHYPRTNNVQKECIFVLITAVDFYVFTFFTVNIIFSVCAQRKSVLILWRNLFPVINRGKGCKSAPIFTLKCHRKKGNFTKMVFLSQESSYFDVSICIVSIINTHRTYNSNLCKEKQSFNKKKMFSVWNSYQTQFLFLKLSIIFFV